MAYEKHVWECDEDITDELLNHIEEGIEDASGFEAIEVYTYSFTIADGQYGVMESVPAEYYDLAQNVMNLIREGKTIMQFAADFSGSTGVLYPITFDNGAKDVIAHQKDPLLLESTANWEIWVGRKIIAPSYLPQAQGVATIYAICR